MKNLGIELLTSLVWGAGLLAAFFIIGVLVMNKIWLGYLLAPSAQHLQKS